MKRLGFFALLLFWLPLSALAQTPNPVTPGYQICVNTSGTTQCSFQPVDSTHPLPVTGGTVAPAGATIVNGNATGTTGAVVGTLAAASNKTTYICGFNVSAIGGTAAVNPVVAGLSRTQSYVMSSATTPVMLTQSFNPCLPASATNTAITVTTTAAAGATAVTVNSWGYQQ
jgi:hypothetical protein